MHHPLGIGPMQIAHRLNPSRTRFGGEEYWSVYDDCWKPIESGRNNHESGMRIGTDPSYYVPFEKTWCEPIGMNVQEQMNVLQEEDHMDDNYDR